MKLRWEKIYTVYQTMNYIIILFRRYNFHIMQCYIGMMFAVGLLSFFQPWISGWIVNGLLEKQMELPLILFVVQISMTLTLGIVSRRMGELLEQVVKTDLQMDYIRSLIENSDGYNSKGELLTSFYADTTTVAHLGKQMLSFVSNAVVSVVSGLGLLIYQPIVFVFGFIGTIIVVAINYRANVNIGNYTLKKHQLYSQYSEKLSNVASAYEELRVQNMYNNIVQEIKEQQKELKCNDMLCDTRIESPGRMIDFILGIVPVVGYVIGVFIFPKNGEYIGYIVTIASYLTNFLSKSSFVAYVAVLSEPLKQSIERINSHLADKNLEIETIIERNTLCNIESIEACNISYAYIEGRNVIKKINFAFSGKGMIGFFGSSGAGKSTMFKMLLGYIIPTEGNIYVNGIALQDINQEEWRKSIGYLHQGGNLFHGTICENMLLFNENPDYTFIDKIATILNIKKELGEDYLNIVVTEGSGGVSMGQKERLRLLCVLAKKPQILLLDEPGANLDTRTRIALYDCLKELSKKILIVCSAHDAMLETYCDHIVKFE